MPRERPILFSGPMVRAILDGSKTQTRRIVKPQPSFRYPGTVRLVYGQHPMSPSGFVGTPAEGLVGGEDRMGWLAEDWCGNVVGAAEADAFRCPYGEPGRDRLWVRETWRTEELPSGLDGIRFRADDAFVPIEDSPEAADRWGYAHENGKHGTKWRPSIFMRRWASRLTLEVAGVRVERLHDISEEDARAEGVGSIDIIGESVSHPRAAWAVAGHVTAREHFAALWDEINGARASWASNPWVWVVGFKRIEEARRP